MGDSRQEADRYLIEMTEGQPIRTDERAGYRGRGKGVTPFIISYLYVIGFSLLALKTMVTTNFNKRLLVGFLSVTVFIFFLLPGGHLITIISKLLGSLGVRAIAGEVGEQHIEKYSFSLAVVALVITLGITIVVGRALCGYGCPVGAVQELLYEIPTGENGEGKLIVPTKLTFFIRVAILCLLIGLYLTLGIDLIQLIAPYQLWRLEIILPGFFVILSFFVVSIFVYRPFCRLFCPYGAIASLVAKFSLFKLKKGDTCVNCGKCDVACPTGNISQKYGECYLCGRCLRACNVEAIAFC